jgi:hypothetical protein
MALNAGRVRITIRPTARRSPDEGAYEFPDCRTSYSESAAPLDSTITTRAARLPVRRAMKRRTLRKRRSGRVVLDVLLGIAFVFLAAYTLWALGHSFRDGVTGAGRFFGI